MQLLRSASASAAAAASGSSASAAGGAFSYFRPMAPDGTPAATATLSATQPRDHQRYDLHLTGRLEVRCSSRAASLQVADVNRHQWNHHHGQLQHLHQLPPAESQSTSPMQLVLDDGDAGDSIPPTPELPTPPPPLKRVRTVPTDFRPKGEWTPLGSESESEGKRPPAEALSAADTRATMEGADDVQMTSEQGEVSTPAAQVQAPDDARATTRQQKQQVTVVELHFHSCLPSPGARRRSVGGGARSFPRVHAIRLVYVCHPETRVSTAYVHVVDWLGLVKRPFSTRALAQADVDRYTGDLRPCMTRLCDEDVDPRLTHSSTAAISTRSWLLPIGGYRRLLSQPAIASLVERRAKHFGEEFRTFCQEVVVRSLQIMNQGPQPEVTLPDEPPGPLSSSNSKKRNRSSNANDEDDEDAAGASGAVDAGADADSDSDATNTGAAGEWDVHCILHRTNDLYHVHWCDTDGAPFPADDPGGCTWEKVGNIDASCREVVDEFRAGRKCPVFEKERRRRKREKRRCEGEEERQGEAMEDNPTSAALPLPPGPSAVIHYRCRTCGLGLVDLPALVVHRRDVHQSPTHDRNLVRLADRSTVDTETTEKRETKAKKEQPGKSPVTPATSAAPKGTRPSSDRMESKVDVAAASASAGASLPAAGSRTWLGDPALIAETRPLVDVQLQGSFGVPFKWLSPLQQLLDFVDPRNSVRELAHRCSFGLGAMEDFARMHLAKRREVLVATFALGLPLAGDVKRMRQAIGDAVRRCDSDDQQQQRAKPSANQTRSDDIEATNARKRQRRK